jgi:hypothetical protein
MSVEGKTWEEHMKETKLGTMGGWLLATYKGVRVSVRIDTICGVMDIGEGEGCAISVTTDAHHVNVDQPADEVVLAIAWHGDRQLAFEREVKGGGR